MALYRKWRPNEFEEVKGQEHIITTLKNQVIHDRVGHAYLFCGTRGTGKTTVAKLFAKTVNCEHPQEDGSPCNKCTSCKAIQTGVSLNVKEIDAASNNGVDNIRDIREEVQYSPTDGKYKVYIIDEAHMLSIGAFNALLKTLEEPPSYVIFILATTEAHKIPVTILSRCQRYDFRRISLNTISERLTELLKREGFAAEDKAIRYIAKVADGSMRDALSLLDQCISFYLGETLTYENVLEVLGAVDVDIFNQLMLKVSQNDTIGALDLIDKIIWQGRELSQFVTDFTWYMRNLLLIKSSNGVCDQLDVSAENLENMQQVAEKVEITALMRYIRVFSETSNQIRHAIQKRVSLEVAIIKLTTPQMETNMDSVLERLRSLEQRVGIETPLSLPNQSITRNIQTNKESEKSEAVATSRNSQQEDLCLLTFEDTKEIINCIHKIAKQKEGILSLLKYADIQSGLDCQSVVLSFLANPKGVIAYNYFSKEEPRKVLRDTIYDQTGKKVDIICKLELLQEMDIPVDLTQIGFIKN